MTARTTPPALREDVRTPDRERFLDAVHHRERDDISFCEFDMDVQIAEQILGTHLDPTRHTYELSIEDMVALNRWLGNDMIHFNHLWRLGRIERPDSAGRLCYIDGRIKSREAIGDIVTPDLDALRRRLDHLFDEIEGSGLGVICGVVGAGKVAVTAMGYETFYLMAALDPDLIDELQKPISEFALQQLEMYLEYPIDGIRLGAAFLSSTGPTLGPVLVERFDLCHSRELIRLAHNHGKLAMLHADGDVAQMISTFIDMGVDLIEPVEPLDGKQDIYALKERFGRSIAFRGNIAVDGVLLHGSPEEVAADVVAHADRLGSDGGYIVSSSHDLHAMLPMANIRAMRDAALCYDRRTRS